VRIEREEGDNVWVVMSTEEAREVLATLHYSFDTEDQQVPGWHAHFGDGEPELTLEIVPDS
jgi:hypothetical protein